MGNKSILSKAPKLDYDWGMLSGESVRNLKLWAREALQTYHKHPSNDNLDQISTEIVDTLLDSGWHAGFEACEYEHAESF